jgi:hypothetical protein
MRQISSRKKSFTISPLDSYTAEKQKGHTPYIRTQFTYLYFFFFYFINLDLKNYRLSFIYLGTETWNFRLFHIYVS